MLQKNNYVYKKMKFLLHSSRVMVKSILCCVQYFCFFLYLLIFSDFVFIKTIYTPIVEEPKYSTRFVSKKQQTSLQFSPFKVICFQLLLQTLWHFPLPLIAFLQLLPLTWLVQVLSLDSLSPITLQQTVTNFLDIVTQYFRLHQYSVLKFMMVCCSFHLSYMKHCDQFFQHYFLVSLKLFMVVLFSVGLFS